MPERYEKINYDGEMPLGELLDIPAGRPKKEPEKKRKDRTPFSPEALSKGAKIAAGDYEWALANLHNPKIRRKNAPSMGAFSILQETIDWKSGDKLIAIVARMSSKEQVDADEHNRALDAAELPEAIRQRFSKFSGGVRKLIQEELAGVLGCAEGL